MAACPEFEALILDRAAGALEPAVQARLTAHLARCPACAAEARATEEALGLAALPPPSPEELEALEGMEDGVRAAWRRAQARSRWLRRSSAALLAAAAAVLVVVMLPRARPSQVPGNASAASTPGAATSVGDDEVASWVLSDPLAETLDDSSAQSEQSGQEQLGDVALADPQTTVDLFLNPGE